MVNDAQTKGGLRQRSALLSMMCKLPQVPGAAGIVPSAVGGMIGAVAFTPTTGTNLGHEITPARIDA